jgi:hypothetical protein
MRLVTPLTFPDADAAHDIRISLAKRERESAQILISTAADVEWRTVTLHISPNMYCVNRESEKTLF